MSNLLHVKRIVVLSGAGISAESGLKTFRDSDGLWENYSVYEVATPEAWMKNPALVMQFYNERRKQVLNAQPNAAHKALAELEKAYDVHIITQNIDDLHERAGSSKVLHLHGNITFSRSSSNPELLYPIDGWKLELGQKCKLGSQLRPHVVWFGEAVPAMEDAYRIASTADIFIVVGTSLNVYPAAGLVNFAPYTSAMYLIDPKEVAVEDQPNLTVYKEKASTGVTRLANELLSSVRS